MTVSEPTYCTMIHLSRLVPMLYLSCLVPLLYLIRLLPLLYLSRLVPMLYLSRLSLVLVAEHLVHAIDNPLVQNGSNTIIVNGNLWNNN